MRNTLLGAVVDKVPLVPAPAVTSDANVNTAFDAYPIGGARATGSAVAATLVCTSSKSAHPPNSLIRRG